MKPSARQAPKFPAKRRRTALEYDEDESWIDSLLLLDDTESFEPMMTNPRYLADQQEYSSDLMKKDLDGFQTKRSILYSDQWCIDEDSQQQTSSLQDGQGNFARVATSSSAPLSNNSVPKATAVSPFPNPKASAMTHHVPPIDTPSQQQQQLPSIDHSSSSYFSMSKLKKSKEPTLLTLTSYPYRIMYCNEAFSKLCWPRKAPVIGDRVFDAFGIEGSVLCPSIASFPTLIDGHLDKQIALVPSSSSSSSSSSAFASDLQQQRNPTWIRCRVQAYPVNKQDGSNSLLYFAIRFTPIQEEPPPR